MMRYRDFRWMIVLFFVTGALAVSRPSAGGGVDLMDSEWPSAYFEGFGGFQPATGWVRDDVSYGVRAGYNFRRFGVEITWETLESTLRPSTAPQVPQGVDIDAKLETFDFSLTRYLHLNGGHQLVVYGGPGVGSLDISGASLRLLQQIDPLAAQSLTDDFFSLHAGVTLRRFLGESRVYVRPDLKVRWLKEKDDYRISFSVAFGIGRKQVPPLEKANPSCSELSWELAEIRGQIVAARADMVELSSSGEARSEAAEAVCGYAGDYHNELEGLYEKAAKCKGRKRFPSGEIEMHLKDMRKDYAAYCERPSTEGGSK